MIKLSLRKKLKIWRETKIWLREEMNSFINSYDLQLYMGIGINGMVCSYFVAEKIDNKVTITQISKTDDYCLQNEKDEVYIFGTEGIFYKVKGTKLEKILDKSDFSGIGIAKEAGVIFIFKRDRKDIVARLISGQIRNVLDLKKTKCIACGGNYIYFDEDEIRYLSVKRDKVQVIFEEDGEYEYYSINKEGMYYGDVRFKRYGVISNLFGNELVEAYDNKCDNVIVSLVEDEIKIHLELDRLVKLDETYYLAMNTPEEKVHVLKYVEGKCVELESIQMTEYYDFDPICIGIDGLKLYKIKVDKGMMILLIYNNTVKYKF